MVTQPSVDRIGRRAEQPLLPRIVVRPLDRQLQVLPGVRDRAQQVHGEQRHHRQVGAVRRHRQPGRLRHPRHPQRPRDAAEIEHVRLHHVDRPHLDHPPPDARSQSCSPPVTGDRQRVGDRLGLLQLPVGAGLLEMLDPLALEQPPDLDRPRQRVAAVGVGEQRHPVPERPPHRRHDRLGPPRPLVAVVADLGADPELEGVEPRLVAQPQHPRRLGLGRDVALHRRGVGPQPPRPPAEQLAPPACPPAARAGPRPRCRSRPSPAPDRSPETCARARPRCRAARRGRRSPARAPRAPPAGAAPAPRCRNGRSRAGPSPAPLPRPSPGRSRRRRCRSSRSSRSAWADPVRARPGSKPRLAGRRPVGQVHS